MWEWCGGVLDLIHSNHYMNRLDIFKNRRDSNQDSKSQVVPKFQALPRTTQLWCYVSVPTHDTISELQVKERR